MAAALKRKDRESDHDAVHGKRTAMARAMSGTTRQMAAQFYAFAEAYAQADDETQHEASQALIAAYPQYASLVGHTAAARLAGSRPVLSASTACSRHVHHAHPGDWRPPVAPW